MSYELDDTLSPDVLGQVDPGTNILLAGPSMSGKQEFLLRVLARGGGGGDGSVVVSTQDTADEIVETYEEVGGNMEFFFRVIDCVGSDGSAERSELVRTVNSPGDLTGIGIEFSQIGKAAQSRGVDRIRVGFDSISPLLMYVELQRVFRFLHVFTSQIETRDWMGLFVIDPESHEQQAVNTIRQLFDAMIEIRVAEDGTRELRTRGMQGGSTSWVPME